MQAIFRAHLRFPIIRSQRRSISSETMATRTLDDPMAQASLVPKRQKFDYLLVLDFEATCDDKRQPFPQEIIELPCLKVNTSTWQIESQFHQYVRPVAHPILSSFCTELTGIVQDMVENQPNLEETLKSFDDWLKSEGLIADSASGDLKKWAFITCGDWDLKTMLKQQCEHFDYQRADYFRRWINLKKMYFRLTKTYPKGMMQMLETLNLPHEGRHHSGIDDCRNIAQITRVLGQRSVVFDVTGSDSVA
jgi:ERI1 exoribonuclease 3